MKNIKSYQSFNEGKITRFFLKHIMNSIGLLDIAIQKVKGTYIPFKFKDKNLENKIEDSIVELLECSVSEILKMYLIKKYRDDAYNTSFTSIIKSKTGFDIYSSIDDALKSLVPDNIVNGDNPDVQNKLNGLIRTVKTLQSVFKKIDDEIAESQDLDRQFKEIADMMVNLDPRNPANLFKDRDEKIDDLSSIIDYIDDNQRPKELNDILDKVHKFGMASLTKREKEDLDKLSNDIK